MSSPDERPTEEELREAEGYFRRDVDEFHREANVLAGHDPQDVSADPPENLTARRLIVFGILVLAGVVAAALAMGLMAIPVCENPPYNWMPCIPNL
ncbi:hypothetical protein [Enteractinococcus helveticum]|uniref:Uncharacterized protein n=1 Tax=Enteractinococcus helveticum TaxID=1837282 RepID=A0A1B7LWE8_9MICC|nr:hypothetical protein [Enteractinococcus helveticum]OAV59335.1 hypothetical protein A6F49_15875 [Enteractinococcus helveticum]